MIHQLSQSVINKIAAGEVIERPSSVVKELMENALDAKATRIDVYVDKGGSDMIRVVDNGCGIAADELMLAIAPHATSKIQEADDLFRVGTMGFRGEALASIAEISRFRIKSRTADSDEGASLEVVGGQPGEIVPCGCPVGTTMEVLNIFCNTPVRKKYLKSVTTEFGYVSEQFYRLAIPYPNITFTLTHNGKSVANLAGSGNLQQRIADIFGREQAENLIWVESKTNNFSISGYVGHPSQTRSNNKGQYLFLNNRYIRDKSLQHALQEAFRGLITVGRYPIAYLFLKMPYDAVDVNVHPTKMEVRFQDSSQLYSLLLSSIRQKFLTSDMRSHVSFPSPNDVGMPDPNYNTYFNNPAVMPEDYSDSPFVPKPPVGGAGPVEPMNTSGPKFTEFAQFDGTHNPTDTSNNPPLARIGNPPQDTIPHAVLLEQSDFLERGEREGNREWGLVRSEEGGVRSDAKRSSEEINSNNTTPHSSLLTPNSPNNPHTLPQSKFGQPSNTVSVDDFPGGFGGKKVPDFKPFGEKEGTKKLGGVRSEELGVRSDAKRSSEVDESNEFTNSCGSTSTPHSSLLTPNYTPTRNLPRPAIQIHNRYIVTELPEGLAIIDQHALHERILYERIKKCVESHDVILQQLLVPLAVDLTPHEFAVVLERRADLAELGLIVEPFGGQTVLLTAYPAILKNHSPEDLLRDVIELLVTEVKKLERVEVLEEIYHRMACRAATKAGDPLTPEEIQALLQEMVDCDYVHHCPHGRPSILVYSQEELDKQFKRT